MVKKDKAKIIFISDSNDQGSFKKLSFQKNHGFKQLIQDLELDRDINKKYLDDFFGTDLKKDKVYYLNSSLWGLKLI